MSSQQRSIPTEDRMSSLTDPILCHILSFLPTKLCVATSILSKRWLSLPSLHFDDQAFQNIISFRHFVCSAFRSRDIILPLQSFHLKCSKEFSLQPHDINQFVYAAVQRRIQNLNLEILCSIYFKLPTTIFSCRTLVVLHLKGLKVNDLSSVLVDFPLLKTLHLSSLLFERFECFLKLLSGCPILEELQAKYILVDNNDWIENLDLHEENFLVLQSLPKLIRANITKSHSFLTLLLTLLCREKAQVLRAELYNMRGDIVVDSWMDPTITPECLSTQLRTCLLQGFKCTEGGLQFAKYIMQNSKILNTMSIKSASSVDLNNKYQMLMKSASWTRASSNCRLLFLNDS